MTQNFIKEFFIRVKVLKIKDVHLYTYTHYYNNYVRMSAEDMKSYNFSFICIQNLYQTNLQHTQTHTHKCTQEIFNIICVTLRPIPNNLSCVLILLNFIYTYVCMFIK